MCHICGCPNHVSCNCNSGCYSGCPIKLDFSCILYHKDNNEVTELDGLGLTNGATLELVIETIDEKIKQLLIVDFDLPYLRTLYTINTIKQFAEAVDEQLSTAGSSSGTYTPVAAVVVGSSSPTASTASYTRVGNIVTVTGRIDATTVSGTDYTISLTLPVTSNLTTENELLGVVTGIDTGFVGLAGIVLGDATSNLAWVSFTGVSNTTVKLGYSFQYQVL